MLEYEYSYFLQAATSERKPPSPRPNRSLSAVCRRFEWALPEVLARLRSGESIGDELRYGAALLFSRTGEGQLYVVEIQSVTERIFQAADGLHSIEEIAESLGRGADQIRQTLAALADIGATGGPL